MKIIKTIANENGSRPALQEWAGKDLPSGFAWCPDELVSIFYSTSPAGFVNIEVDNDTVVSMSVNEEALAEYVAGLPEAVEPTEPEPSAEEILDAMLGVTR